MDGPLDELRAIAARHVRDRFTLTAIPRVAIATGQAATPRQPAIYQPMMCVVLQGAKEVLLGDQRLRYDPASYFIATVDLAASGCIVQASAAEPYLSVTLALEPATMAELMSQAPEPGREAPLAPGFGVNAVTPELLDALLRLVRLLDAPDDIPTLAPLLEREILYRLLRGPQGHVLRQAMREEGRMAQVRRAIGWIRAHYDRPLRIPELAARAGMSVASFHRHFRSVTAMSPLQFQKHLRLQQARQLLIANRDAAQAGYAVGYESASQFSREYARLFGAPPGRDALRLRAADGALAPVAGGA